MISKEGIKISINHKTERTYSGIKDYYLRYMEDELIDCALNEYLNKNSEDGYDKFTL